jgi:DNA-binding transcriptional MocR family regulator
MDQARANSFRLASIGANRLVRFLGDWTRNEGTLHGQLAAQIRHLIGTGALPSGTRLPSERSLAVALNISRNTVSKSLDELRGDGLVSSRQGDGTYVSAARRRALPRGDERLQSFVSPNGDGRNDLTHVDLRSGALPGLPMAAGEVNLLDGARMRDLIASHGYLPSGLPEFRDSVAAYYSDLGLPTEPGQILVTSGAQQALRLAASAFVRPGDNVVIEDPSFRGAIESLKSIGAHLVGVASGMDGIDVDALASAVAKTNPSLIVVQSTVHNPTGSVMDTFRRSRVASIAARYSVPVIDDATLADTIIDGERRPLPLAAGGETIVTVGSMSKSFWGGLRVGWLRAAPELIDELASVKGGEDLGTSLLAQLLASQLLPQIERARDERHAVLSESRRLAMDAIVTLIPDWMPLNPTGGASMWIRLPFGSATAFAQRAERDGVLLLPGSTFSSADGLDDHLRIAYPNTPEYTLRGIERLAATWRAYEQSRELEQS